MPQLTIAVIFVLIWSTGFIVAKLVVPHADLQIYLVVRFSLTALVMGSAALLVRADWPRGRGLAAHLLAGVLMHGVYLCASYWSIVHGMEAGVMALLGALQPLFTALYLVVATRIRFGIRTWGGLLIGFAGVACVLAPKLSSHGAGALTILSVFAALLSVMAITAGTLFQKWVPHVDLRSAACVQNLGGALMAAVATATVGSLYWDHSVILWSALVWAVLVPSVVGTTLLMWMVRHGEATQVTSLLLLAPPLAAVQAYLLFGETLSPIQFVGFALALAGVLLARSARTESRERVAVSDR
ncbi:MAG TPA: DMT family transporter [Steroidobacteraceae bacterium]|jgi:drug/metabolite transporter (DMT)-like permease